ncbi:Pleckstrin homology domain containing protein [Oryctes borbonicus]|uniref:Pleckstrin homology domain containing protein n=1 Tax=Oryctes borbonicus TaxID=1629725 RepID=A0A0T6B4Q1_9SCAR|nr:Pleckstrin homology domain containing protein [Oryctes borbonicus]
MDSSFTEHILERARERQKKLQQLNPTHQITPPKGFKSLTKQTEALSPNKGNYQENTPVKNTENIHDSPKKVNSEGRVQKLIRHSSSTKISSNLPASPKPQLKTLNIQKENFNMEIKLISSDNVRVEVEIQESDSSDNESQPNRMQDNVTPALREQAKHKLNKLGRLYAGGEDADISSPIYRTEENFLKETTLSSETENKVTSKNLKPASKRGLSKLADLAQDIKQWEDDTNHVKTNKNDTKTPTRKWKAQAPPPPSINKILEADLKDADISSNNRVVISEKEVTIAKEDIPSPFKIKNDAATVPSTPEKTWKLDQGVLKTLESQGFTRTTSNSRLIFNYNTDIGKNQNTETKESFPTTLKSKEMVIKEEKTEEKANEKIQKPACITKKFSPVEVKKEENKITPRSPKKNVQSSIASKTAMFESSPSKLNSDPAMMSLAERKALFERNKGVALIPKAAFAMPIPISNKENKANVTQTPVTPSKQTKWNTKNILRKESPEKLTNLRVNQNTKSNKELNEANENSGIASKIAALINNKNTISEEQINNNIKEQRQKDMDILLNRFNRNKDVAQVSNSNKDQVDQEQKTPAKVPNNAEIKNPTTPERRSGEKRTKKNDSPQVAAVLGDIKRVKVTEPKDGRLYPSLSDIETANETETEQAKSSSCDNSGEESFCSSEGDVNTSFGRDILQAVCKGQTPQKRPIIEEESTASDVSDILDDMDDYLDEAIADENYDYSNGPTPPKLGKTSPKESEKQISRPSNSFHYKGFSPNQNISPYKTPTKVVSSPRKSSDLPTYVIDGDNVLPLTHTVSFYRRQQTPVKTPIRQISRQPLIDEQLEEDNTSTENEIVANKIQELMEEINKQQMVIAQTSQALNLCNSTLEFMGSTEQVEAEKLLLLATHRRQACLHEIQRLKVEGTLRPQGQHAQNIPLEKGSLIISNIVLPMKKEYVRALAAAGGKGHHVVCLVKCGEQVVSTQLTSTVASSSKNPDLDLCVPGTVKLNGIYSDFTLTFEVYCLQAQEEILPHEVKYHINKKGNNKSTPKKVKQESRMVLPPKESPAGPQVVRSSSFALMGYVIFSIQSISKTHWSLNKAPSMSPLEGRVDMKISCDLNVSLEHKGFLTVFEDISGFGAWHRRWYMLKGHTLCYWKYPDDEKKKTPTESINLKSAITREVGPVSRDICARLNTFLIETEREALPDDKESLTLICKSNKTIIR